MVNFGDEQPFREAAENAVDDEEDTAVPAHMAQTDAVVETLQDRAGHVERSIHMMQLGGAAGAVLADIAEDTEEPGWIIDYIDTNARKISQATGNLIKDDQIVSTVTTPVREVQREIEAQELQELAENPDYKYTVDEDDAIGIDEYVEQYLVKVERAETTDYDSDPTYRFVFEDVTVEFEDDDHRHYAKFQETVSSASSNDTPRVLKEIASRQALEDIQSSIETGFAQNRYAELSHGPETRPWGLDEVDWWDKVITSLEAEAELDLVQGPNTDALETLERKIRESDAARDLQSVVDAGERAVHYNEDKDEIWVPNGMIDAAWEDYATSRQSFRKELSHRGITSDELSGDKASEAVMTTTPPQRFWRLKASEVPEPDRIVDEIERGSTGFGATAEMGYAESAATATDGGQDPGDSNEPSETGSEDDSTPFDDPPSDPSKDEIAEWFWSEMEHAVLAAIWDLDTGDGADPTAVTDRVTDVITESPVKVDRLPDPPADMAGEAIDELKLDGKVYESASGKLKATESPSNWGEE